MFRWAINLQDNSSKQIFRVIFIGTELMVVHFSMAFGTVIRSYNQHACMLLYDAMTIQVTRFIVCALCEEEAEDAAAIAPLTRRPELN